MELIIIDVRDHGAKGDVASDDTAAIQAAIDAANALGGNCDPIVIPAPEDEGGR